MTSADLVIRGGTIVTATTVFSAAIAIKDGRIAALTSDEGAPRAERVLDADGLHILPGVIDVHVHLRDPGMTYKEDFGTGTAAAAAGGVTCVFDMPNNSPPTMDVANLEAKKEAARSKAVVDYGLYGLLTAGSLEEIGPLAAAGVIGFKCYMGDTTGKIPPPSDGEMLEQFSEVSRLGRRVAVHAEDDSVRGRIDRLRSEGRVDARAHYESRPQVVEETAVERAILLSRETACPLHVTHLSSGAGAAAVRSGKRGGVPVTAETTPHYLILDDERYAELGPLMKINPSIKASDDRARLWDAINDGTIDMIATDHSPHALEEKSSQVIFDNASGFPGLETFVPLMLTQVNRGMLSLTKFVQLTSENPARAWGIFPRKGSLGLGSDADVTIVDLKARSRVDPARFYSKAKWSPFSGFEVEGEPVYAVGRGEVVMDHGAVATSPRGRLVVPDA